MCVIFFVYRVTNEIFSKLSLLGSMKTLSGLSVHLCLAFCPCLECTHGNETRAGCSGFAWQLACQQHSHHLADLMPVGVKQRPPQFSAPSPVLINPLDYSTKPMKLKHGGLIITPNFCTVVYNSKY